RAQELEEFLAAVTPVQLTNDFSRSDVECSEKRRGAVSHIVVGPPLGDTGRQGQYRLSAIERLNLALLVHAEHHRFDGGIEVKAHDVAGLLHEQRIGGEFERLLSMRLQTEGSPDP